MLSSIFFGIAGMVAPIYIGASMQGVSVAFLFTNLLRLLTLLIFTEGDRNANYKSSILYFSLTTAILISASISVPVIIIE
jgi:hypothetical protein